MTISAYAAPIAKLQFTNNAGVLLAGGLLFTYAAGTTTKATTYQDAGQLAQNTNPIVLDAEGRCTVFLPPGTFFKFTLAPANDTDPPTNALWSIDNIGVAVSGVPGALDTGTSGALVATVVGVPSVATQFASFLILTANASANVCTINVNAWGAIVMKDKAGNGMTTVSFAANQLMLLAYDGTFWRTLF